MNRRCIQLAVALGIASTAPAIAQLGLDPLRDVRAVSLYDLAAPLDEYLSAVADDTWKKGTVATFLRQVRVAIADSKAEDQGQALLSAAAATSLARDYGVRFDQPISLDGLGIVTDDLQRDGVNQVIFRRARRNADYDTIFWYLGGATEFAVRLLEPLNLFLAGLVAFLLVRLRQRAARTRREA